MIEILMLKDLSVLSLKMPENILFEACFGRSKMLTVFGCSNICHFGQLFKLTNEHCLTNKSTETSSCLHFSVFSKRLLIEHCDTNQLQQEIPELLVRAIKAWHGRGLAA